MKQPEDDFIITVTAEFVKVEHPERETETLFWNDLEAILLINTDSGPWLPDIWLTLAGNDSGCIIPHGTKGFEQVYDIVSKYKGFDFENVTRSMTSTDNAEFLLWTKP
ncbi:hypothetical protein [Mucilaginibacter sp. 22184]|uniref:hypothetical protein n=1 Tax=Mucilaginibacter sp. 22184 TaxID=3453887 RepID=UPI003F83A355